MLRYLAKRLAASVLILLGVSIVTFGLTFMIPADPVTMIAGRNSTPQMREQIRVQLGLDKPIPEQYARYLGRLVTGDLGISYARKSEVAPLVASRLPPTLLLMLGAIIAELMIGLPAGIYAATRRGRFGDKAAMTLSFLSVSTPQFVLGLTLLYLFAYLWNWFPLGGYGKISNLILPALTLGLAGGGWYSRMMRSSMIEVLRNDYIRTARAKGMSEWRVVMKHGFRNAILPIVAMIGLDVGIFMSGVVVVENVFGWPGIGQLMWQAIQSLDIPVIMGVTIVAACFIVLGNLIADLVSPLIDPRIRLR
ncbi:MAG: ABC transporter permease [Aestuariivirga sp.]|uniref:ABC transporter permease n=1 Tax=Aestuariivirga sp. TaxID=2650926 RepID=UPI0025BA2022|nr:ABC transporter permease [Aestuariivirga sp.]MCA3560843.1 ABC transporter permease [Aestuariivirga sp.]